MEHGSNRHLALVCRQYIMGVIFQKNTIYSSDSLLWCWRDNKTIRKIDVGVYREQRFQ
jgi:hypothetical protein